MHRRSRIAILVVSVFVATATLARAQAEAAPAGESSTADAHRKSPAIAASMALAGAGASVGLFAIAIHEDRSELSVAGLLVGLIGPSAGHFYTGENGGRPALHMGIRTGGVALLYAGAVVGFGSQDGDAGAESLSLALMSTGAVLLAGGVLVSIIDAPFSAKRVNAAAQRRLELTAVPLRGPDRSLGMGLQLRTRF